MKKVSAITGASSGFGRLSANALAKAGHTVYASMRDTAGRNAPQVADVKKFAHDNKVDLRPIELDVSSEKSIEAAIRQIVAEQGRLNVLMHNAGSPAEKDGEAEYKAGPYKGYGKKIQEAFAAIVPPDADAGAVAEAIVEVVDAPFGKRPFRVHVDPTQDGADVAFAVMDRVRTEMLHRVGLSELLTPARAESKIASIA